MEIMTISLSQIIACVRFWQQLHPSLSPPSLSELCCQSNPSAPPLRGLAVPWACNLIQGCYCTAQLSPTFSRRRASETARPAGLHRTIMLQIGGSCFSLRLLHSHGAHQISSLLVCLRKTINPSLNISKMIFSKNCVSCSWLFRETQGEAAISFDMTFSSNEDEVCHESFSS